MSKLQDYVKDADGKLVLASHLLTKTFPLSGDVKVLLSVLQTIHLSHEKIFLAVLDNEFLRPKVSPDASFVVKFDRFSKIVSDKNLLFKVKSADTDIIDVTAVGKSLQLQAVLSSGDTLIKEFIFQISD